ncbi:MAG: BrnT family toxin [Pseudodesulfovibrio sp.]|uniref:BrnT family toxin n=1 Tax=Pseudodesulfovibrio sp. TaxID=2035812 RepID=UPI003D1103FB
MGFTWDEVKREANLAKHGLDFADAWKVFEEPYLERLDTRCDYGEDRWAVLGRVEGLGVVLVYTEREADVRIISLRKATPDERRIYEQTISKRLGPA